MRRLAGAIALVLAAPLAAAQEKPGDPCDPPIMAESFHHLIRMVEPGGLESPMPLWPGQDQGNRPVTSVSLDRDGALVLEFPKPMPAMSSLGSTAQAYLRSIAHTGVHLPEMSGEIEG